MELRLYVKTNRLAVFALEGSGLQDYRKLLYLHLKSRDWSVCLDLGLSTLVQQGLHLLDPSADLHQTREETTYITIKPSLSRIIHI